ncbi:MAG: hypothetical protein ACRDQA_20025 [Nocardioidaceae bacterium]
MGYAPQTDPGEFLAVARLAASANLPTYTHVRELVQADPQTPVETGERIADEARLREVRALDPGAECIVEYLDERDPTNAAYLRRALGFPDSIVASDAMPVLWGGGVRDSRTWPLPQGGRTHPRTAGTFAKPLRLMVRESGVWSWAEGFRRCSYLPARVLDDVAPYTRAKGHLDAGADADIVVLDPERITDAASYLDPTRRPPRFVRSKAA